MATSNPSRAAAKRLDRFIASYGDELLSLPKSTQNHLIDLVWNGHSARARAELLDAVASQRAARSQRSKQAARQRLVEPVVEAYRAVRGRTRQPVDFTALRRNVARNEDPELSRLVNRYKGDMERLGQELRYRASTVGRYAQFISGTFYHGRATA